MQVKVVHYSGFVNKKDKGVHHPRVHEDQYYFASWSGQIARRIKNRAPELDIEVWSLDREFDKLSCRNIQGIKACIFPYQFPVLIPRSLTFKMFFRLRQLSQKHLLIIHTHSIFNFFNVAISFLVPQAKLVISHHGGLPPDWKSTVVKEKIKTKIYDLALKRVSFGTYLNQRTKQYVQRLKNRDRFRFLPVGADFQLFKRMDKSIARKELNLEEDTIYGIYIGNLYHLKGVDIIMDTYDELKNKYEFKILFVGKIYEQERDLYERIQQSDCMFFGPQNHEDIPLYLSAADFYLHPVFAPVVGFDVSLLEAMAIGLPVVSSRLVTMGIDYQQLGYQVQRPADFSYYTEKMIHNFQQFNAVRDSVMHEFDANISIPDQYLDAYDEICNDD